MAKAKAPRRPLESCTIKHINKTINAGDCVLMRPADQSNPQYVARIERIDADARGGNVKVLARWYYRPEESIGGRRQFHGSKELFLSDHYDVQSADTIEGKCTVHSFKSYTKLDAVGNDDFFCRFEYNSSTGAFNPDRVAVDWFHPACIEMTAEEAKRLDHFFCETCSSEGKKKLRNSHAASRPSDTKVDTKRRRR
ncbi:chromatin remodeling protein SHL isoform X4 [Gossypium hirsutum]|uniref:Chromatin remodeling protein SHL isoform X4 n=1 Tax=Gossypium hirsutum TaxID=3635 RepID=A0A1U8K561_GOSHI|nr:chromatin remodeling protein SHL-like isoform X4 [Gossypium hirsutum]